MMKIKVLGILLVVVLAAVPAAAQISKTNGKLSRAAAGTNCVAFDEVNEVYLIVYDGSPGIGIFADVNGAPMGAEFLLTPENPDGSGPYVGWYNLAFGGPPGDPVFLLTYIANENNATVKYTRLVRHRPGAAPIVSDRSLIVNTNGVWYAAEKAQSAWDGDQFVVGTYVQAGAANPEPQLHHVDTSGAVSGGQLLGDGLDYYGAPALACSIADKVCLVTGFANGLPFAGAQGGSYYRMIDAETLTPFTAMDYLDDHASRAEDHGVVFNPYTRQFLTVWWARGGDGGWLDSRTVALDGTKGALDYGRSFGPGAGDNRIAFNTATRTSLVVSKYSPPDNPGGADFFAVELGDDGAPVRPDNVILITPWDGSAPLYKAGIAADNIRGRWFVEMWFGNGLSSLVQGTPIGPQPDGGQRDGGEDGGVADTGGVDTAEHHDGAAADAENHDDAGAVAHGGDAHGGLEGSDESQGCGCTVLRMQ